MVFLLCSHFLITCKFVDGGERCSQNWGSKGHNLCLKPWHCPHPENLWLTDFDRGRHLFASDLHILTQVGGAFTFCCPCPSLAPARWWPAPPHQPLKAGPCINIELDEYPTSKRELYECLYRALPLRLTWPLAFPFC